MSIMWEQALTGSSVDLNFGFIMANCSTCLLNLLSRQNQARRSPAQQHPNIHHR
jgi:hypothetical protein